MSAEAVVKAPRHPENGRFRGKVHPLTIVTQFKSKGCEVVQMNSKGKFAFIVPKDLQLGLDQFAKLDFMKNVYQCTYMRAAK
jgi:hypothetical protein